jgi:NADH dehydrogenase (ubiquinone) 1 alpha subcomplex subunit 9
MIADCVRNSDIVFNLVGKDYETKNYSFTSANVDSARNISRICREEGVSTLVHMSHISANSKSPSLYLKSKAMGEEVAREEYPNVTVVRSATVFGHEDRFLHQIAWLSNLPSLPVLNEGKTIRRPICVSDLASALVTIGVNPKLQENTFELAGYALLLTADIPLTFLVLIDLCIFISIKIWDFITDPRHIPWMKWWTFGWN